MDVYTYDIAKTLWTFYTKNNLASWKILSNQVCMCHCTVVFPYLLSSWNWVCG